MYGCKHQKKIKRPRCIMYNIYTISFKFLYINVRFTVSSDYYHVTIVKDIRSTTSSLYIQLFHTGNTRSKFWRPACLAVPA